MTHRGLSLLEVVLALGIFSMTLAAIAHLVASGTRAAITARLESEAILRCESKLAEVVAGSGPIRDVDGERFDDDRDWQWSLQVHDGPLPHLLELQMNVRYEGSDATGPVTYTLTRLLRDPSWLTDERARERLPEPPVIRTAPEPSPRSSPEDQDQ